MNRQERSRGYAALGDEKRLQIVDELLVGDRTVAQLASVTGLPGNLLAHHLGVLEEARLIERRVSEGDRRHRYVTLLPDNLPGLDIHPVLLARGVVFVCTRNSARSQFAAALWEETTGLAAASAGSEPAGSVHPKAVQVASEFGIDLSGSETAGYDALPNRIDLIVSVCDRANETSMPEADRRLHWSITDPVTAGNVGAFRTAFSDIERRVTRLAAVVD